MVKVGFCWTGFSATKIMTWKYHVDNSTESRYNMILGTDLLATLGLGLTFSEHFIIGGTKTYEGFLTPIADINDYDIK